MKRKEIKNLARKIGEQEQILLGTPTPEERARAEAYIQELSSKVGSFEDMVALDEAI
jgi:hypothetical protein